MLRTVKPLVFSLLCIGLSLVSFQSFGQSPTFDQRVMFVEIEDLDPYTYKDIVDGLEGNVQFTVKQSCVPAGLIMLSISPSNDASLNDNFTAFKSVVMNVTELEEMKLIAEYSEEEFNNRCSQFRMRKPEK
ncbi:MAG: hypothetical protein KDC12_04765 [Flavobacteriales bacterium]|nr:hypothetical protein [Flavobacteriales bacterium]